MTRNKILLFLVVFIVILTSWMLLKVTTDDVSGSSVNTPQAPKHTGLRPKPKKITSVDRDTYINTIETLNQRSKMMEQRLNTLEHLEHKNQQQQKKEPQPQLDNKKMVESLIDQKVDEKSKNIFGKYQKEFNDLVASISVKRKTKNAVNTKNGKPYTKKDSFNLNPQTLNGKVSKGLGFPSLLNPGKLIAGTGSKKSESQSNALTARDLQSQPYQQNQEQMVTIKPFTQIAYTNDQNPVPVSITGEPVYKTNETSTNTNQKRYKTKKAMRIPFYTIPRNGTLFDNVTFTALMGIVPNVKNSILDPIRFKIITGTENLASNGYSIPGVENIVWSGIAIGNREMSCVRGEVNSVTFTFKDGRIYTQSSTKSGENDTTNVRRILGYITDTHGNPCISGKLITNAQDYLKDRVIASGAGSLASAFAQSQQTTSISQGTTTTALTGSAKGSFIAGQTLAGSLAELSDYLKDRQRNAVDLVYLQAGQDVVLHVEKAITIDYEINGRKLHYANTIPTTDATTHDFD